MEIFVISICNKNDQLLNNFSDKHIKQIENFYKINFIDIGFNTKKKEKNIYVNEGKKALSYVKDNSILIGLDTGGHVISSNEFAKKLQFWQQNFSYLYFFIGGPDGLPELVKNKADTLLSLSKLTFPHQLVKIILSEQLYRSICIINNHPYHR